MANIDFFCIDIFSRNKKSLHCRVNLPVPPPIFTTAVFSTSGVNRIVRWRGSGATRVRGDRRILKVISVDIGPQIGAFSLRGRVWPVSGDKKGASAEGENIDISGEISIRIDIFAITKVKKAMKKRGSDHPWFLHHDNALRTVLSLSNSTSQRKQWLPYPILRTLKTWVHVTFFYFGNSSGQQKRNGSRQQKKFHSRQKENYTKLHLCEKVVGKG